MKDFTLGAYKVYLKAIRTSYSNILRFDEFFLANPKPETFCLLRHDVDRRPKRALQMAKVEKEMGIRSTYYFRAKPHVFNPRIITKISKLGHEIGYHYESLSDTNGDIDLALKDFEKKLTRFREIVTVKTISMHGRPLKPFDNRDIWRTPENHRLLFDKYVILGEVYLDIDYKDIAYINDTGRNWFSNKSNIRDQVESNVRQDFDKGEELYNYLASNPDPRVVFQVHPERWSDHITGYYVSLLVDLIVNVGKHVVNSIGERR